VIGLGVVGMAAARHDEDGESVKPVAAHDIAEKLDGKESTASAVEVTIEPGKAGVAHRHPGPGLTTTLAGY
jgi:quercetin dioxygenase-like cupin family protein